MSARCTEAALEANTKVFAMFGAFVARKGGACLIFLIGVLVAAITCAGMYKITYENNLEKLWMEKGSRAETESDFLNEHFGGSSRLNLYMLQNSDKRHAPSSATDFGMLTAQKFLELRNVTSELQSTDVNQFTITPTLPVGGVATELNITLGDICDRPDVPPSLKPWTNSFGGPDYSSVLTTLGWLGPKTTDAGGLYYVTNCLSEFAKGVLSTNNLTTISDFDYIQLQMWYQEDVDALLDSTPAEKLAKAAERPGLPMGWGISKFPCTRANALDCYAEGIYDYPEELRQLNEYGYSLGALTDSLTLANFSILAPGVEAIPGSGIFLEDLFKPEQLGTFRTVGQPFTWLEQCVGAMQGSIKSAVQVASGVSDPVAEETAAQLATAQLQAIGFKVAIGLGYWWRPTIAEAETTGFAYSFYEGQKNVELYTANDCIAEGAYRKMDSIKRKSGLPYYSISALTEINGGCCIAWSGTKVTSSLYSGGQSPSLASFTLTTNTASRLSFQGFVAALRITNSNINHMSPFFISRLHTERGVDTTMSDADLEKLPREFEQNLIDYLEKVWNKDAGTGFGATEEYSDLQFNFLVDRSVNDLFEDASNVETTLLVVGYVVLIIYACGTFVQFGCNMDAFVYSRGLLCFYGIFTIGVSTAASYGVVAWADLTLSPVNSTLVPFLSMGLGIDDLFVLMHEYVRTHDKQENVPSRIVHTMMNAGSSITVTSAANIAAFLVPAIIVKLPAVYTFSYQMAAAIALNWFMLMTLFCPVMVLDAFRAKERKSLFPCLRTGVNESSVVNKSERFSSATLVTKLIVPLYANPIFKAIMLALWVAMTIWLPIHGKDETVDGLRLSDVTIKGSYVKDYLSEQETLFPIVPGNVMSREIDFVNSDNVEIDMSLYQENILQFLADTETLSHIDQTPLISDLHWLPGLIETYNGLSNDVLAGIFGVDPTAFPRPGAETIPAPLFYPMLRFYLNSGGATSSQDLICRVVATGVLQSCLNVDGNLTVIAATRGSTYFKNLYDDPDYVDAIKESRAAGDASIGNRDLCCNSTEGVVVKPVNQFFAGYLFKYWQQYVGISDLTFRTIGWSVLGIGVTLLIFQASPISSLLVVIFLVSSILQIYGIMAFLDIKLNGFSVTNLSIGLGIGVEFTAHIAYAFLRYHAVEESRGKRIELALVEIFPPMFSGAITTLISVAVLAFAKYPFFKTYFFEMIAIIIFVTFVNGMVFLPIVLSLIGPGGLSAKDIEEIEHDAHVELSKKPSPS